MENGKEENFMEEKRNPEISIRKADPAEDAAVLVGDRKSVV